MPKPRVVTSRRIILKDASGDSRKIAKIIGCTTKTVIDALRYKSSNSLLQYRIRKVAIESFKAQEVVFPD